jgi:hypothetical protein
MLPLWFCLLKSKQPVLDCKCLRYFGAVAEDKAERVLADVEHQFMQGLRRKDGRTVGLGL